MFHASVLIYKASSRIDYLKWWIMTCKSNYMASKVWDEITYPFRNFNACTIGSLGMDKLFHPTLYNGCKYLSMLGLELFHVSKMWVDWPISSWWLQMYWCQIGARPSATIMFNCVYDSWHFVIDQSVYYHWLNNMLWPLHSFDINTDIGLLIFSNIFTTSSFQIAHDLATIYFCQIT